MPRIIAHYGVVPLTLLTVSLLLQTQDSEAQEAILRRSSTSIPVVSFVATARAATSASDTPAGMIRLAGHIAPIVAQSKRISGYQAPEPILLSLSLPLRNKAKLDKLLAALYNPTDVRYGHYLSTQEFTDRFCPTQKTYDAVAAYAKGLGLTVTKTQPCRTLINVRGTQAQVESAFVVHLMKYRGPDGRVFHAPASEPMIASSMSGKIQAIIGLSDSANIQPLGRHRRGRRQVAGQSPLVRTPAPAGIGNPGLAAEQGSGYLGGFTASDIRTAYNLNNNLTGAGQTLAVFELDTYVGKDIQRYELDNNIANPPALKNIYVDTASYARGSGTDEVVLDIDLQIALAPAASSVLVYTGPYYNTSPYYLSYITDTYQQIATDNLAKQISTSWGSSEDSTEPAVSMAEDPIFQQMAAQGQSIYAASGDLGSYDNGSSLSVDDPAVEQHMCGVGGTTLLVNDPGTDETYGSETVWNNYANGYAGAGGGGVSSYISIPSYQTDAASYSSSLSSNTGISTTMRNVPDVALNSDPQTGYLIYVTPAGNSTGSYSIYAGTSAAAPLWAGFTALVNQNRTRLGLSTLGFPNMALYNYAPTAANPTGSFMNGFGTTSIYTSIFHDITVGNNSYTGSTAPGTLYPAVAGFDCATGLGTFNGNPLIVALSGALP